MAEEVKLNKFKLDDSSIAHIVKLIQLGFITGTDVVDHFRMIELVSDDTGNLYLDKTYEKRQLQNIEKMLSEANEKTQDIEGS
tara:strand:- start:1299 stop:1547 length:249 start_codon:yes stop_codon:yes gene_type:complete